MGIGGAPGLPDLRGRFNASGKPLYTFIYFPQGKKATTMAVCYSKAGSVNALLNCEKVASGIKISGAKVYDLVPSSSYASSLSATLNSVSKSEQAGYQTMRNAKSASAQAKAARQIASAYSTAAGKVRKLDATPYARPENLQISKALSTTGGAYQTLASAAAAKSSSRYSAASKKVKRRRGGLSRTRFRSWKTSVIRSS